MTVLRVTVWPQGDPRCSRACLWWVEFPGALSLPGCENGVWASVLQAGCPPCAQLGLVLSVARRGPQSCDGSSAFRGSVHRYPGCTSVSLAQHALGLIVVLPVPPASCPVPCGATSPCPKGVMGQQHRAGGSRGRVIWGQAGALQEPHVAGCPTNTGSHAK